MIIIGLVLTEYLTAAIYLVISGAYKNFSSLLFTDIPLFPLAGMIILFYIKEVIHKRPAFEKKDIIHLETIIFYIMAAIPFILPGRPQKTALITGKKNISFIIRMAGRVHFIGYNVFSVFYLLKAKRKAKVTATLTSFHLITLSVIMMSAGTRVVTEVFSLPDTTFAFQISLTLIAMRIFYRFIIKDSYHEVTNTAQQKTHQSHLNQLNIEQLDQKIKQIMEIEKLYCDEDLPLKRLSSILNITTHQLSEFINKYYKVNYYTFLYKYRIDAAKQLMANTPNRSNLDIAMDVGFNSYTPFYTAFKKNTGCSPAGFRKKSHKFTYISSGHSCNTGNS